MHHRHVRVRALVALTSGIVLSACGGGANAGEDPTMHLSITSSDSPDVVRVDAAEGAASTIANSLVGDVEVTVEAVDGDAVEFSTSKDMAPEGKTGGINLNDTRSDFTVKQGNDVKFSTPTMDAGTTWTATLEDGPAPS